LVPPTPAPPPPQQPVFASGDGPAAPPPRLLIYSAGGNHGPAGPGAERISSNTAGAPGTADGQEGGEDLAARLKPTPLTGVSANVLRNQPYLLTMGTLIPCVLQTAMDSTLPGFVSCVIPQDVQGKTGLTLLDRSTRVVGEFRGGVRQGIERLFVVWTRAETPQGVVIHLDSPATDPLGRSGMDGEVDRRFWQRFGGALLLTLVDGIVQAGVAQASKEGTTTINTGQAQSVIAESLRGTINIPPTIRKNQGELVSLFVARDLDFSTVYRVQPTPARYVAESRGRASR
jgi:type IV secretion system protein VirB10